MIKNWVTSHENVGQRADVFLAENLPDFSRSTLSKYIKKGLLTIDGKAAKSSSTIATSGVEVVLEIPLEAKQAKSLPVTYQDENVLVINKPSGILSHTKGAINDEFTVADFISDYTTDDLSNRQGIVHRLDRGTSGVMITARTSMARVHLQKQFQNRKVKKTYLAVVSGEVEHREQTLEWPIERNPKKPSSFRVGTQGKEAITDVEVIGKSSLGQVLKLMPKTGRTHQLRVHLSHMGNPIIGDKVYGGPEYNRLLLHALSLQIALPGGEVKTFEAPAPVEFDLP